jgi:LEA14-like dessication related protein
MRRRTIIMAGTLLGAAACATLGRGSFTPPEVLFRDARITGLGISGGSLEIVLGVYNPNNFRLDGSRLTYAVSVDSVPIGSGAYDDRFVVERGDTSEVRLPMSFTYAGLGVAGQQLLQRGSVEYHVDGDVTVQTPLGRYTRPYHGKGTFSTIARPGRRIPRRSTSRTA